MQSGRLVGMAMVAMWLMVRIKGPKGTRGTAFVACRRKAKLFFDIAE